VTRVASVLIAASAAAVACVVDWAAWQEYYGDGPPYYGLTTNMDKWSNPRLFLLVVSGVALMVVAVVLRLGPPCHNRRAIPRRAS
jgi:hypothetical protein